MSIANKKTHWLRTTLIVLIACGIAGVAVAGVLFMTGEEKTYTWATVEFSFDGAADGLAPNGTAFGISDVTRDDVLAEALETAGFTGKYTPEQIRPSLIVRGTYPEDIVAQMTSYDSLLDFTASRTLALSSYHPTRFSIALYNDFDPSLNESQLKQLLNGILAACRNYFDKTATLGFDSTEMQSLFDLETYDYPQRLQIVEQDMTQIADYARELYEKEPTFLLNGAGFNEIYVRLNNLIENDVSRLNANITMNALTRDTNRLLTQYQFEIKDLTNQLEKQQENLTRLDVLIAAYDKNEIIYLSTSESLTKIDGNSSETYDALVADRKDVAAKITDINSQIQTYRLKISDLLGLSQEAPSEVLPAESTEEELQEQILPSEEELAAAAQAAQEAAAKQLAALEANINTLVAKRDAIAKDFSAMLDAYNRQEINESTVTVSGIEFKQPKLLSGAFIKKCIKTAGPLCAVGFMVCLVLLIIDRKKEEK